jgi:Cu2+-exporting ATPase
MKTQIFNLGHLCCVSCADDIEHALRAAPHIEAANVDYQHDTATVTYHDEAITPEQIAEVIMEVGLGCTQVVPAQVVSADAGTGDAKTVSTPPVSYGASEHGVHTGHTVGSDSDHKAMEQHSAHSSPAALQPSVTPRVTLNAPDEHSAHAEHVEHVEHVANGHAHATRPTTGNGVSGRGKDVHVTMAHLEHQTQMAPIAMGTKMDRMQYEMPATAAQHVHEKMQHRGQDHTAMAHGGMDHDMSDPKMARAMELDMRNRFFVALLLTIPTLLYSPLFTQFFGVRLPTPVDPNWIMFVLSTPVVWWPGWFFISGAYQSLRRRALNMSVLIATGVLAAYLFSVLILFVGGDSFFEAAAMLVTFVLFGHWIEMRARRGTNDALRALFDLVPPQAHVMRDGQEVSIPTSEVIVGDLVVLRPGDKVPVDGEVLEGETTIDEALVTGESMPVHKGPGDPVVGGSINQAGSVTFRATKVGSDTVLAQIAALVTEAQNSKAPSQRLADTAAQYLVILAVGSGVLTFLAWYFLGNATVLFALTFAISAVVIACPDALGLATPTAVAVGTGLGAKYNILIKDAATLEQVSKINTIVLDKTGTLTEGKPRVTDVVPAPGFDGNEVLHLQAGAESRSSHPISLAILQEAQQRGLQVLSDVTEFEALSGRGVRATVEGKKLLVGTARLMSENGIDVEPLQDAISGLLSEGKTISILATDGKVAGVIAVADPVKANARKAIQLFKGAGIEPVMITGDNKGTAQAVASQLGIDRFYAEVLPADKANYVKQLQSEGKFVAMVGDGINDAPALAQANIGIAIGAGTDVAIQTADVVLMKSDPLDILRAVKLSKATLTKMKQNLFWASIYNVLAIPVAAGVLYPGLGISIRPEFSALLMSASSIIVATNAVLLKRVEPKLAQVG